ncbi:MAG: PQQ-binding-like beta-propeller repeat protein [Alphaproteobacteria bacterium]|nr:PQQ-binding-like beta-propeller repeat protein [Alphaproteobacteria bacterium]
MSRSFVFAFKTLVLFAGPLFVLSACSHNDPPLPGDRLAILKTSENLKVDESLEDYKVEISEPVLTREWTQSGMVASHLLPHFELASALSVAWKKDIGAGSQHNCKLLSLPIISENKIYTLDSYGKVSALRTDNGALLWHFNSKPSKEESPIANGGLAYDTQKIFVATGFAQIIALDAQTGKEIWHQDVSAPIRSAPSVSDGRVFVVTIDNTLFALSQEKGEVLWTHAGMTEYAGLLGGASPAIMNDLVVAPFSSGEVVGIKVESGHPLWGDALTSLRRTDSVSSISTIKGNPVIDHQMVFVIGHGNRMFALNAKTGEQIWEKHIGGLYTPLVHKDVVFVVTNEHQLLCLKKETGQIVWIEPLQKTLSKSSPAITWAGPILAQNKLYLTNSLGNLVSFSPVTGKIIDSIHFKENFQMPPVIAGKTMYLLAESGKLYALK